MSFTAAIDISTFIWSEEDFNENRHEYYNLLTITPSVYDKIRELKLPVLLRTELLELIMGEFPHNMVNEISSEFGGVTLSFLTKTNWFSYTNSNDNTINSTPEITKPHFSNSIQAESQSQVCHLFHNSQNPKHKFIAYNYFYNNENELVLNRQHDSVRIDTLRYSSEADIINFFDKYKIKFRHNPKHDKYKSGGKVSPLSCYNERVGDTTKAQALLEKAYKVGDDYYYLDEENNVYVQFVTSNDGTYHGFDISDEKNNVPNTIKSKFNRNGRVF